MTDRPVHHRTAYDVQYSHGAKYMQEQRDRAKARYDLIKKLGKKALAGKDLDHVHALADGGSNNPANWRIRSIAGNRGDKSVFHKAGFHTLKS